MLATLTTPAGYCFRLVVPGQALGCPSQGFPTATRIYRASLPLAGTHLFPLHGSTHGAKRSGSCQNCSCGRPCDGHRLIQIRELRPLFHHENHLTVFAAIKPQEVAKSPRPLPACIPGRLEWTLHLPPLSCSLLPAYSPSLRQSP